MPLAEASSPPSPHPADLLDLTAQSGLADLWHTSRPWLLGVIAVLLIGWVLSSESRLRQARRLVFSQAAFLVPGGLAMVALIATGAYLAQHPGLSSPWFHENPFGLRAGGERTHGGAANLLVLLIVAITAAGHVGLLEAWRDGRRPDGFAFWRGMRRHAPTLFVAKLLIAAAVWLISGFARPGGMPVMLYLLPSVLLAPLPGVLSREPGGLRAISATVEHAYRDLGSVTWRVILLLVFCLGLLRVDERLTGHDTPLAELAVSTSTLSWNPLPFAWPHCSVTWSVFLTLAAMVFSTISVTAHWLALNQPLDDATDRSKPATDVA